MTSMTTKARTIALTPGRWMTALSWEHWISRYVARGHHVIAKSWLGMAGDIEQLRCDPSTTAHLGVTEIVECYESVVRELAEPPIIIGHSFGGAIAQIILDHGFGAAGVAIDSAPLNGILRLPWASLKSRFRVLKSPANSHNSVPVRTHFILGLPGWQAVADFALSWALNPVSLPIAPPMVEAAAAEPRRLQP